MACDFLDQLEKLHQWLHIANDQLSEDDWEVVDKLRIVLIELMNARELNNAIKIMALAEALATGCDLMENREAQLEMERNQPHLKRFH